MTPSQAGFPGARLAARLITRVKRAGKWTTAIVYLLTSLTIEQLQAEAMLQFKRGYWVIESRLHHCLDSTMQEDLSRVRSPNSARVLGTIRRIVLSLANAALDKGRQLKPKTKATIKSWRQPFLSARCGVQRLLSLISAKSPEIMRLAI